MKIEINIKKFFNDIDKMNSLSVEKQTIKNYFYANEVIEG